MGDPFDLARFVSAQDRVWPDVLRELGAGRKTSHWMWFVFPQLAGLGTSAMSRRYAISGAAEAAAYLAHPVLGPRLAEVTALMMAQPAGSAEAVLGAVDAAKLRSSLTLFAAVGGAPCAAALARHFGGEGCGHTRAALGGAG